MKWLRGPWVKWALVTLGLLTTSCAGAIGVGAAVVVVGAGVLSMTCYDRMTIAVTDQLTGTKLCDAKVTFTEDGSVTEATPCYSVALSTGKYQMRVERRGLVPYEAPVEVNTGSKCRHAVQTIYVALERPNAPAGARMIGPPEALPPALPAAPATVPPAAAPPAAPSPAAVPPAAPSPAAVPPAAVPPAATSPAAPSAKPGSLAPPTASATPARPAATPTKPPPAATAFPDP